MIGDEKNIAIGTDKADEVEYNRTVKAKIFTLVPDEENAEYAELLQKLEDGKFEKNSASSSWHEGKLLVFVAWTEKEEIEKEVYKKEDPETLSEEEIEEETDILEEDGPLEIIPKSKSSDFRSGIKEEIEEEET